MKKTISYLLILVIILGTMVPGLGVAVAAADEPSLTSESTESPEGLVYEISDGEVTITGYAGSASEIVIPAKIEGCPVKSIGNRAFYRCSNLTSITIPDSVTTIGSKAFYDCENLTSITIPDRVTSIGGDAFYGTSYYNNSSNWENNVLYIGIYLIQATRSISGSYSIKSGTALIADFAFYNCESLTSITIPNSVTSIGSSAFYYCTSLTSITIPDSVTSIGEETFRGCKSLTSITIPDSVASIGGEAFYECTSLAGVYIGDIASWCNIDFESFSSNPLYYGNLYLKGNLVTNLKIPDGVTTIGNYAFEYCESLTSITIPDSVTTIGDYAFYNCESLKSITVSDRVTTIGHCAFYYCTGLTSITIPDSVTSIGYDAFYYCSGLTAVYIEDIAAWCNIDFYSSIYSSDSNPLLYARNLYLDGNLVTDLVIPDGVTSIGSSAFYNCESLTSITIPDSVTSIGKDAFFYTAYYNNSKNWENGVLYIENYLIDANTSISGSYSIKSGTTLIADSAFSDCTRLTSIIIPDSVTTIDSSAFLGCSRLSSVHYWGTEEQWSEISIGNDAFPIDNVHFEVMENAKLSQKAPTCTEDGYIKYVCSVCGADLKIDAIMEAYGHTEGEPVIVDPSCAEKGTKSYYCTVCGDLVRTEDIPAMEHTVEKGVCTVCNLETGTPGLAFDVSISNGEAIVIYYSGTDKEVYIPKTYNGYPVTSIEEMAFYGNTEITSVFVPQGINSIGASAFYNCKNLKKIEIPACVTNIGYRAFYNCPVTIYGYADSSAEVYANNNSITFVHTDALGHIEGEPQVIDPACTEKGSKAYYCTACNKLLRTEDIVAPGHTVGAPVIIEPTCTEKGTVSCYCTVCEELLLTENIDAVGHTVGEPVITEPTCTEKGTVSCYCTVCEELLLTENIDAIGHTTGEPQVIEPTCTEKGTVSCYCTVCEELVLTEIIDAIGHTTGEPVIIEPTCTENGTKSYYCTVCEEILRAEDIAANGHTPGEAATCTKAQACTVCGEKLAPSLGGHVFVDEHCSRCGMYEHLGDVDGDGRINSADSNLLKRSIAGLIKIEEGSDEFKAADVDGNGRINSADSNLLKRSIAGAM